MFIQKTMRGLSALSMVGILTFSLFSSAITQVYADPPGDNGTIKMDGEAFDAHPDNEPHLPCTFEVDAYNYDADINELSVTINTQSPTNPVSPLVNPVFTGVISLDNDDASGANEDGLDGSLLIDLTTVIPQLENNNQSVDGFKFKIDIDEPDQNGQGKFKVFWIEGCEAPTGSISGYKWNDADGNGNLDNDQKLSGWTIFLDENDNQVLDNNELSDITDNDGNYEFTGLTLGEYTICEVMQSGWEQTFPDTQSGCTSTTLTENNPDKSGKTYSFGNKQVAEVNPCDPSTYNGSVAAMISETGSRCVGFAVAKTCGQFSAIIDPNLTPYTYRVSYSVDNLDWNYTTDASNVTFAEDQSGGTATVYYWAVGPEKDFFTAHNLPWYQVSYGAVEVDTDCLPNKLPQVNINVSKGYCESLPSLDFWNEPELSEFQIEIDELDGLENDPLSAVIEAGCGEVETTPVTFTVYKGDSNEGEVVDSETLSEFPFLGSNSATFTVDMFETYTICETFEGDYTPWVLQLPFFLRPMLLDNELEFTQDDCITVEVGETDENIVFVNLPISEETPEEPTPTPTPTPEVTPTPTGQVLSEQVEKPVVTQLPSTNSAGGLSLVASLVMGAILSRKRRD